MKRDMDLVRKILLAFEADEEGVRRRGADVEGSSNGEVGYHIHLMVQAGLLENLGAQDGSIEAFVRGFSITWAGYDFLEASRDQQRWEKVRTAAKSVGGMTLDVLKATLIELATAATKKAVGLP